LATGRGRHPGGTQFLREKLPRARPRPARNLDVYQTNLPTVQGQTRTDARLPGAHALTRRTCGDCRKARQRPPPACGSVSVELARDVPRAALRPADASGGEPERGWPATRRLRRPADFAALATADRRHAIHAARHFLAMTAVWRIEGRTDRSPVRFGVTVGRRQAPRAVDRSLAKRIVREAARHAAHRLERHCDERGLQLDVGFRLKAPRAAGAAALSVAAWRRALRAEAEQLLAELLRRLATLPAPERGDA
jgi:ribonuclease P protein component